ncbi:S66 peptidase family protein [Pseudonocardia sp. TRM90224]|uniref:S66 peptidase family protein n=1 Tax=Pseudonocardia sp. TRM90224 TaxID=2812678 RepID=UPI001E565CC2|nr:LD-carboxypeptidase [Pseudonocardia sp. TRM90224]
MESISRCWPEPLRVGDRVEVIAPAGPPPAPQLAAGLDVLRSWGLDVRCAADPERHHPTLPYLAGTDAERAAQLQKAWCDPGNAAVVCARGGYGALRILDLLDWTAMAAAGPKVFTGSSDITALHAVLGPACGLVTMFTPLVASDAMAEPVAQENMRRMLFEREPTLHGGPSARTLVGGTAAGPTVGGTLSLIVSTLGVAGVPAPPDGSIVLLEDITEAPYRIDHFLTHLLRSGWFDTVAGVVLGSWLKCGKPERVHDVMVDRLGGLGIPVVEEFGFGHAEGQLSVPLGASVVLDADTPTLTFVR